MTITRSMDRWQWLGCAVISACALAFCGSARALEKAHDNSVKTQDAGKPQASQPDNSDSTIAGDEDLPPESLPANFTPAQRIDRAWSMLTDAAGDAKHPQFRIDALAALGLLNTPHSAKLIETAMSDPDVDVRTAAVLAAGQTGDRNLTTPLRNLLDDKEPQVVFIAAMTLWRMGDPSGEDILMAVADGDRGTNPTMMHGAEHKIDKDLHDPGKLARLGAMQGAAMMMGPFGFSIAAVQFVHQSGGNAARASAIQAIGEERTEPIHKELIAALGDKDQLVRAAAARGLVDYRDSDTSAAIYPLFVDPRHAVRLTAAAAYLRTTGVPGPSAAALANAPAGAHAPVVKH